MTGGAAGMGGTDGGPTGTGGASTDAGAGGTDGGGGMGGYSILDRGPAPIAFSTPPGAVGLSGTAVESESPNPESAIYVTTNTGPPHTEGENTLYLDRSDLGLLVTDDIDGFSILKPVPSFPLYYFSVVDRAAADEGVDGTQVRRSSVEGEVPGDLFQGVPEPPSGPVGVGANMLWTDEIRIGLQPETFAGTPLDDVNALEIGVPATPTRVWFSVTGAAQGASGSAVEGTAANERGCTIFESPADGTNSVLATCADLGLVPGDEVDGLVVLGSGNPQEVHFSVAAGAIGAASTPINTETPQNGADVWRSTMNDTHEKAVSDSRLGLLDNDDIDALAIEDRELLPKFEYESDDFLVPSPFCDEDTGPQLYSLIASTHIADNVGFIIREVMSTGQANIVFYDFETRDRLGSVDVMLSAFDVTGGIAGIPGPAWSPSDPLADVELWVIAGSPPALHRFSGEGGAALQQVALDGLSGYPENLIYKPAVNHFAINLGTAVEFLERPAAGATSVPSTMRWSYALPAPCHRSTVFGYDPRTGGLDYADYLDPEQRICQLTNELWFREPPRSWIHSVPFGLHRGFFALHATDVMQDRVYGLSTETPPSGGCPLGKRRTKLRRRNR